MKNVQIALKRFLSNKNTVTVLGVFLGILVLYVGYNVRIKNATNPSPIPYAVRDLKPGTKITSDDVGTMNVPAAMIKGTVIKNANKVVGKYVNADTIIPKGSLFYTRAVVDKEKLPGVSALDYPDGYVLVNLEVNMVTSYANLIYPGNYIDLYLKIVSSDENNNNSKDNKIMLGKLLENVKVLAVVDSNGNNVFADVENKGTPAMIIFAVPEEYHILLRKSMYLKTYDAKIIPVPTSATGTDGSNLDVTLTSSQLKDFINKVTIWTEFSSGNDGTLTIPGQ